MNNSFYCDECGEPYETVYDGTAHHVDADGEIDHDADEDHVPFGEEPFIES